MQYHLMSDYYFMMLDQMVNFYRSLLSQGVVIAIIVLILGGIVGVEFGKLVANVVRKMGVDKVLENTGVKEFFKKGGVKFSFARLMGWLAKWFIIMFALMTAVDLLGLSQVSDFLANILNYVPNLIGAVAILVVGLIVAQMLYEAIKSGTKALGMGVHSLIAAVVKWSIIVITVLVVLEQIGIKTAVLQIVAGGLSLMVAIAGGLAFGLGGQQHAKELLDEIKGKLRGNRE
jgi:small-conductance mechanosensitive channel